MITVHPLLGQDCISGSSYENENANSASIDTGHWYLNLEEPCSCSGEVVKYDVRYYDLGSASGDYSVNVAVWEPRNSGLSLTYDYVWILYH